MIFLVDAKTENEARDFMETLPLADQPVRWIISPVSDQLVQRHCPKCHTKRLFAPSHHFRVNANKRTLDVWHIYKCIQCDDTWNVEIISRRNLRDIPANLYTSFLVNDPTVARRYSFDYQLLSKHSVELADPPEVEVRGANINECSNCEESVVVFEPEFLLPNRLGAILSKKLGVSRTRLSQLVESGVIGGMKVRELNRRIKPLQTVRIKAKTLLSQVIGRVSIPSQQGIFLSQQEYDRTLYNRKPTPN